MGKGEERNGTTTAQAESFLVKSSSEASKMLEAALLQMDDIISGTIRELIKNTYLSRIYVY